MIGGAIDNCDQPRRDQTAWSTRELERLRELAAAGAGLAAIAAELGRSPGSIRSRAHALRISLRRAGERRGSIIGELPDRRLPADVRAAVFLGTTDPLAVERRTYASRELCPSCAMRPISTRAGYCEVCHLRELTQGHRDEIAVVSGRREVDAARAAKYRARRASR